jgi:AraC-like DNA-binding protein
MTTVHCASPTLRALTAVVGRINEPPLELLELFDHLEDVFLWIKDDRGRFQWINLPLALNFGVFDRAQVIGQTDFDMFARALADHYRLDDERVLRGERVSGRVELVGRFDHTAHWCVTHKMPLRNKAGDVVGSAGIAQRLDNKKQTEEPGTPLAPAILLISQHYSKKLTNLRLAGVCGLSVRTFERLFRVIYGVSPHRYVRELRVRLSCNDLVYTKNSIAKIAVEFGFADQSHFNKEFRRFFGEMPREYRMRFSV